MVVLWMVAWGCAPPPLSGDVLPSISFIFPQSRTDITVCPSFLASVDVRNWSIVPYEEGQTGEESERLGHWHLRDSGGDYLAIATEQWTPITLSGDFTVPTLAVITAHLANHDHNELNTVTYPDSTATAEFMVGDTADCIGGGGGMDTSVGY
jgi:hypothetical protein